MRYEQPEIDFDAPAVAAPRDADLPPECLSIVGHLACECLGRSRAKTARQIAEAIGLHGSDADREVRKLISAYKDRFPVPVCGHPGRGFYVASDPDDMSHYERSLHSVLRALATSIRQTRRNFARCGFVRTGSGASVTWSSRASALHKTPA